MPKLFDRDWFEAPKTVYFCAKFKLFQTLRRVRPHSEQNCMQPKPLTPIPGNSKPFCRCLCSSLMSLVSSLFGSPMMRISTNSLPRDTNDNQPLSPVILIFLNGIGPLKTNSWVPQPSTGSGTMPTWSYWRGRATECPKLSLTPKKTTGNEQKNGLKKG